MYDPKMFFVFDVESVGLHGEGFAVGYVVVTPAGTEMESGMFACDPHADMGILDSDFKWVKENVPFLNKTHNTTFGVRNAFWDKWMEWKAMGAIMVADCGWPVEHRFLSRCIDDKRPDRDWDGPYPLLELASLIVSVGDDALKIHDRHESEHPAHNPLNDARQSARLWCHYLSKIWYRHT